MDQAKVFEKEIKECGMVLFFDCPESIMIERIMERSKNSDREDDNEETIKKRLKTFTEMSAPVADYYEKQGKCALIPAFRSPSEIYVDVQKSLNKYFEIEENSKKTLNIIELGKSVHDNGKIEAFIEKLNKRNISANYVTLTETSLSNEVHNQNELFNGDDVCLLMNISSYMRKNDIENIMAKLPDEAKKMMIPKISTLKTMINAMPQMSTLKLGKPNVIKYDKLDELREGLLDTLTKDRERDLLINGVYWNVTLKDTVTEDGQLNNDICSTESIILVNQIDMDTCDGIREELSIDNFINTLKSKFETYTEISILDTPKRPLRKDNIIKLHFIYNNIFKVNSDENGELIKNTFINDDWMNFLSCCNLDESDLPSFWTVEFVKTNENDYEIDNFKCDILSMLLENGDDYDLDQMIDLFSKCLILD